MINIRTEKIADHPIVFKLLEETFANEKYSDQTEPYLVEKLRKTNAFIPELSLVAEIGNQIIGYILLTKIQIDEGVRQFDALALAPVAVLPDFQQQGIGRQLILEAHKKAKQLGHERIILLGHADYYPRFGYEKTSKFNIQLPFEAPEENCMVLSLTTKGLENVSGTVIYPKAFFE